MLFSEYVQTLVCMFYSCCCFLVCLGIFFGGACILNLIKLLLFLWSKKALKVPVFEQ